MDNSNDYIMYKLYNPHDKLIKEIFSRKVESQGLVEGYTPEEIIPIMDIDSLEIYRTEFIDKLLEEHRADLIFKALLKGEKSFVHLIFENKSDPKKMVGLDLLEYKLQVWNAIRKENPELKKLPPLITFVLYCGKKTWNLSENFQDIIEFPEGTKDPLSPPTSLTSNS